MSVPPEGALDGFENAGESDVFAMKFDAASGELIWTLQRGTVSHV